jgi:hypothetical protein
MPKTHYGYVTLSDIAGISLYETSPREQLYISNGNLASQLSTHIDNIRDDLTSLLKTIKRKHS